MSTPFVHVKNRPCANCWELAQSHARSKCTFQPTHYAPLAQQAIEDWYLGTGPRAPHWKPGDHTYIHFLTVSPGLELIYYAARVTDYRGRIRYRPIMGTSKYDVIRRFAQ